MGALFLFFYIVANDCSLLIKDVLDDKTLTSKYINELSRKYGENNSLIRIDAVSEKIKDIAVTKVPEGFELLNLELTEGLKTDKPWEYFVSNVNVFLRKIRAKLHLPSIVFSAIGSSGNMLYESPMNGVTTTLTAKLLLDLLAKDSSISLDVINRFLLTNQDLLLLNVSKYLNLVASRYSMEDLVKEIALIAKNPETLASDTKGEFLLLLSFRANEEASLLDMVRKSFPNQKLPVELVVTVSGLLDKWPSVSPEYFYELLQVVLKEQSFNELETYLSTLNFKHKMIFISHLVDNTNWPMVSGIIKDLEENPITSLSDIKGELLWYLYYPNQFSYQQFTSNKHVLTTLANINGRRLSLKLLKTVDGLIKKVSGEPLSSQNLKELIDIIVKGYPISEVSDYAAKNHLYRVMPYLDVPYLAPL